MAHADEPRNGGAPAARGAAGPALAPAGDRPDPAGDRMDEALKVAAVQAEETGGLGRPGRPVNKRSPFFIGMTAAAGVAVTYGLVELVIRVRSVLVLIGLALFIAIGLDPVVAWLTRRRVPRWAAVVIILLAGVGIRRDPDGTDRRADSDPAAAALRLLLHEVAFRRLDRS
jgi:hypothetical protein